MPLDMGLGEQGIRICKAIGLDPSTVVSIRLESQGGWRAVAVLQYGDDGVPRERWLSNDETDRTASVLEQIKAEQKAHAVSLRATTDVLPPDHEKAVRLIRELADLLEHMATDTPWDQGTTLADVHMATLKALTVHIEHHGRYVTHTALLGHPASPLTR